ncbi:type III CRISPR-associated RAMP protein Csx7 [Lyngbya confervoides]|uniref:CRISPR-associated RAMP protein Csx7 n=1 Tax=Lyngbya confervoides BDU141951 TaxID=1574623 RepID=A0ABD4T6D3_9CYAN|nr:CRISPR-associated RAMP protein Csx7 [Lyngbya confervoides]MCM1984013.1 CRISPR-associated RAMP protein Csx7 [Lyngbya confervoides BDU141951]
MFDIFKNRLEMTATLTTVTAMRISEGRSLDPIGPDLPVIKDALGQPYIPGSSFKGAMRSRLESFVRAIVDEYQYPVSNPAEESEWAITSAQLKDIKKKFESQDHADQQLTHEILEKTDIVSRVFGSPWMASKLQIRDLPVQADGWFGQYQERDGVSIDRDTETAADSKLYNYQVVPAHTAFEFQAVVENATPAELGLILFGLHQFQTQQIPLGGGRSRGLGVVELSEPKFDWFEATTPEVLLQYLKENVENTRIVSNLAPELREAWSKELIDYLSAKA